MVLTPLKTCASLGSCIVMRNMASTCPPSDVLLLTHFENVTRTLVWCRRQYQATSLAYSGLKQPLLVRPSACREQCPFLCDLALLATCMWDCTESTVRTQGTMRWLVAGDLYWPFNFIVNFNFNFNVCKGAAKKACHHVKNVTSLPSGLSRTALSSS